MPRRCLAVLLRAASIAVLSGSLACAHAVEIGEVMVRSYLGQPLVADIELTGFSADGKVDARLAHPDVFHASNVGMHPVLPSLRMSVMRRDGRQFVHITSIAPVQTQYVHLFLDLGDGGRRNVRAASLPFVADPRPAPPPVQAPAAVAAPVIPAPKAAAPAAQPVVAQAPLKAAPRPVPPVMPVAAPAASCPKPRFSDDEMRACATRDYKNAMLSAQIVELEEKVKALQATLDGPSAAGAAPLATAHKPAQAKAAPPQTRIATVEKATPPADSPFPWMWIGAVAAALAVAAAGVVTVLKRRGKMTRVVVLPKPGGKLMGRLKGAMHRDKKPGVPAEPVEQEKETVAG